jgi:hypothetical protein
MRSSNLQNEFLRREGDRALLVTGSPKLGVSVLFLRGKGLPGNFLIESQSNFVGYLMVMGQFRLIAYSRGPSHSQLAASSQPCPGSGCGLLGPVGLGSDPRARGQGGPNLRSGSAVVRRRGATPSRHGTWNGEWDGWARAKSPETAAKALVEVDSYHKRIPNERHRLAPSRVGIRPE